MNKINITRSFSRKKQVARYEPIDVFCSVTAEGVEIADATKVSKELFDMCKEIVLRDIDEIINEKAREEEKKKIALQTATLDIEAHSIQQAGNEGITIT